MSVIAILTIDRVQYSVLDHAKKPIHFASPDAAKDFLRAFGVTRETIARMDFVPVEEQMTVKPSRRG